MNILGRDGSDLEFGAAHREHLLLDDSNNSNGKKKTKGGKTTSPHGTRWFSKLFDSKGGNDNHDNGGRGDRHRSALGDFVPPPPPPRGAPPPTAARSSDDESSSSGGGDSPRIQTPRTVDTEQDADENDHQTKDRQRRIGTLIPPRKRAPKPVSPSQPRLLLEDRVAQDCSFFYQDLTDQDNARDGANTATNNSNNNNHNHTLDIPAGSDALATPAEGSVIVQVQQQRQQSGLQDHYLLPFRDRAAFKARYEQLNAVSIQPDVPDDLYLYHGDNDSNDIGDVQDGDADTNADDDNNNNNNNKNEAGMLQDIHPVADFSVSSLYYYTHDGRLLMKLPKDKVQLLMDPHLEPGILSVLPSSPGAPTTEEPQYVMTVDPDLYQRVVQEIQHNNGLASSWCFGHKPHADIRIAWIILAVLFALLLAFTIVWPLD